MKRAYLDYNATAPLRPAAARAVSDAMEEGGNASSVHAEGRAAHARMQQARRAVAALVGAGDHDITFTSGGTEAAALALTPSLRRAESAQRPLRLFVSAVEHPCVLQGHRFPQDRVEIVPVTPSGVIDLAALRGALERLGDGEAPLVSLMLANNETGVIQPVAEAAALAHEFGGFAHTDAVQAAGKIPFSMADLGVDLLSLSGHKIGGPQGIGALVSDPGLVIGEPMMKGGGQEKGVRGGTENSLGIAGFGAAACEAADLGWTRDAQALRDRLEAELLAVSPELLIAGAGEARLPNTSCFALAGVSAETALIAFDLAGIAVSSGSACSSGKVAASHVLKAMEISPDAARGAIRVSLGWNSGAEEIDRVVSVWREICERASARQHAAA